MAAPFERTSVPGIYRRGGRYVVTFTDDVGVRRKRSAATMAEARVLRGQLTADIARGEYRPTPKIRFSDYVEDWVATYQGRTGRGIRKTTLDEYAVDLRSNAVPHFGRRLLGEIDLRDVKGYAAALSKRGLAPSSIRNQIAPLRALFATALEEGLIRVNPCTGLRLAGRAKVVTGSDEERSRALTPKQLDRLIEETPPEWRLLIRFLAQTGLRIGELVELVWRDIDLDKGLVRVRRRRYKGTIEAPKSEYGVRNVPLAVAMAADLAAYRAGSRFGDESDHVFPNRVGKVLDGGNALTRIVKPAAEAAGVGWAGFHTLRHTCASTLFRAGWNAKQVQIVLGHHSPEFTLSRYVHLIPEDLPVPVFST